MRRSKRHATAHAGFRDARDYFDALADEPHERQGGRGFDLTGAAQAAAVRRATGAAVTRSSVGNAVRPRCRHA
ncbi:hypothetical protein WS87_23430 [Burkholderia sp. MSMB0856]|nr:hypothetical protein WS87_23430 [Burkholderia sp. MSMB0856]